MAGFLLVLGALLGLPIAAPLAYFSMRRFWNYFAFCLLQQVALDSFSMSRLLLLGGDLWKAVLLTGAMFALCHLPNPVLALVTLLAGW